MSSTSEKQNGTVTKKSGKGSSHGVISEVSAYLTVKPGHEEEVRAACRRFGEMLRNSDPKDDPEFQVGMLAMKTEAGRTTNHAASST
jgi:hypothetical protein